MGQGLAGTANWCNAGFGDLPIDRICFQKIPVSNYKPIVTTSNWTRKIESTFPSEANGMRVDRYFTVNGITFITQRPLIGSYSQLWISSGYSPIYRHAVEPQVS